MSHRASDATIHRHETMTAIISTFMQKVIEPTVPLDLRADSLPLDARDRRYRHSARQWGQYIRMERDFFDKIGSDSEGLRKLAKRFSDSINATIEADPRIVVLPRSFHFLINDIQSPYQSPGCISIAWTFRAVIVKKSWLRKNGLRKPKETPEQEFERVTGTKLHA